MLSWFLERQQQLEKPLRIKLTVNIGNEDAVKFYKHHGFDVVQRLERYYPRLEPPDAYEMARNIHLLL